MGNHEASQLLPTNPYAATKAAAEMLVMAYARSYGLPAITTRGNCSFQQAQALALSLSLTAHGRRRKKEKGQL